MSENLNRIWRPSVEPNQTKLPQPGTLTNNTQQEFYTTTSLVSSEHQQGLNEFKQLKQLNNEIITACQAFNSSPKPFSRQESSQSSISQPIPSCVKEKHNLNIGKESFQQKRVPNRASFISNSGLSQQEDQQQENSSIERQQESLCQEDNMAPKLVHNQYNSPLDLYSMNNIRKTIEAHTELIAPGLKGINFMKPEAPINKQSEVYKLVMEEEERARSQQGSSSRLSPISGQPLNIPTGMVDKSQLRQPQAQAQAKPTTSKLANQSYTSNSTETLDRELNHQKRSENGLISDTNRQQPICSNNVPVCCECGQFIHSTFARIQNKFIHPHCFNCTTCGTSLKNTGYFTINEKLYCDIHAKQVANLMNIKYDFDQQQKSKIVINQQQTSSGPSNQSVCQSQQQRNLIRQQEQQQTYFRTLSNQEIVNNHQDQKQPHDRYYRQQQRSFTSVGSSPATISTMFADRSCSNISGINNEGQEIRWTWRPATSRDQTSSSTSSQTFKQTYSNSASQHEQSSPQILPTSYGNLSTQSISQQQQQSTVSLGTRGRGLLKESSANQGGRIPVCVHCNLQIQGPYILAGKTTWCKTCSQSNFNCSSCRRSLLDIGFIEDNAHKYYCESCFEVYYAPICSKCNIRIKGDCLNALGKQWHPSCFVCGHCRRPFGNSSFYLEDNLPYCERDWNVLFTTKCYSCSYPIEAGDKWIEALDRNYHSNCFKCSNCQTNLEGSTFYCKNGKPYCRLHAR